MNLPVHIESKHLFKPSPKVSVYYPLVAKLPDSSVQKKMNLDIISQSNNLVIDQGFYNENLVEMIGYFEIKNNQRAILSLSLIVYSFTGGAHGITICKPLTFDVATGKLYSLKDLFKQNSDYVKVLSTIIARKIREWEIPVLEEFREIRVDQDFYIADHCLVIFFQVYEITPYVYNFPYFPIPIKDIENIIRPGGPLEIMLPF
ncbi:DUF3298 domain-containing protein [Psychrobacillus sp.]|uniref:DUF3298 and DUF4163 domain-containing protein n=1 Tax=Psychrobacillus sp. TaxID=1871623 RepID=UPI0028BF4CD9|nr:DUF3298 domain-containing protein [Psychrobacillus sp.]